MDPALFKADLEAKPAALRALAARLATDDPWAFAGPVRRVIFLGMGSSRYAAQVAARRLRAAGIDAAAEYASADGGFPFPGDDTLIVAISASGTSRETLDAVAKIPRYVALTNVPSSPLAEQATAVVDMAAGVEAGGVACRSFQHTLALLDALVTRLTDGPDTAALVTRAAEATEDLLDRRDAWFPRCAELLGNADGIFPMAPVERLSSALQSALMFREGPRVAADGCETGDWAHVDVYLTKTLRYRSLLFPGSRYDEQALEWMHSRGSTIVSVGGAAPGAALAVRFRHDDDSRVRLLTETLIAELVAADWWAASAKAQVNP
ncbi:sigma factor regulator FecR [Paractinoplanes durhamensis]|uniref:Glutamine--fructose-6-phosphate aminotransferase [isomerizing] n=1 Tax=Paractinoplanes durhamensis TaxID=113563 RepID=A0ABQ3YXQ4_9ACTN|nr:sigma factor regulator FecR [Actinoplanes durhamensis]